MITAPLYVASAFGLGAGTALVTFSRTGSHLAKAGAVVVCVASILLSGADYAASRTSLLSLPMLALVLQSWSTATGHYKNERDWRIYLEFIFILSPVGLWIPGAAWWIPLIQCVFHALLILGKRRSFFSNPPFDQRLVLLLTGLTVGRATFLGLGLLPTALTCASAHLFDGRPSIRCHPRRRGGATLARDAER